MSSRHHVSLTAATRSAWFVFDKTHPSLYRIFFALVLPLSLLPPIMLYYAGTYHGDAFAPGLSDRNWAPISLLFLVAEMVTIAAMGPLIQWIAWLNAAKANLQNAYLLAFVAPLPLWLSSLGLIVPNFFFTSALAVAAMVMACFIIYHGVATLLQISEDVVAGSIAYGIMACGMVAWALLLIAVFPVS
jgi:hypothetical protein